MKTLNKTLSLILALAMVFGLMGVASAAFTDQSKITHTTAVNTCVALNIINGYSDGSYAPAGLVTRAELCKMICIAYNGGVTPTLATTTTPTYTDTANNWASAYIEYCTKLGIVSGTGNGMFDPDGTVTGTQAAKMMLVALGYNAKNEGFTGTNWDVAVNVRANEKKLYNELVSFDPGTGLNRDNAAQMIYNMLNATEVEYTYNISTDANGKVITTPVLKDKYAGTNTTEKLEFVEDKYGLDSITGYVKDVSYNSNTKLYTITLGSSMTTTETTLLSATDFEQYYGQMVKVLYKTDVDSDKASVYGVVPYNSSVILSGVVGQLSDSNIATQMAAGADNIKLNGTTYKFTSLTGTPVYYNLAASAGSTSLYTAFSGISAAGTALAKYKAGVLSLTAEQQAAYAAAYHQAAYTFKMIDNNGDSKIDLMVVYPIDVAKLTSVSSTKVIAKDTVGATGTYTADDDATIYSGAAKNDYAKITDGKFTVDGLAKLEKITPFDGAVTETTSTKATIGGIAMGDFAGLTAGKSYTGLIQANGFIWTYTNESGATSASDYAVVVGTQDKTTLSTYQAKLLFSDGTQKIVDTDQYYDTDTYAGTFVTFTKDSSGVYTLYNTAAKLKGNYDLAVTSTTAYDYDNKLVGAYNVADDAVVFVQVNKSGAYSYKTMTGAAFKSVTAANVAYALGAKNTTTGYGTLSVVYAKINSGVTTGDTLYGYITSDVTATVLPSDSTVSCNKVVFWDGSATKTLYTDKTYAKLAKGQLFAYTLDTNGNMVVTSFTGTLSTVTGYADPKVTITGASSTKISSTDTTKMFINSSDGTGVADGSISYTDDGTKNVWYINGSSTTFSLIIYDMSGSDSTATAYTA